MGTYDLGRQTIAVFGASGGLGGAVVARLRADGARVIAVDARPSPEPDHTVADALDEASVAAVFATYTPTSVVNLIGGYTPPQPLADLDLATLTAQLDLNVRTAATITKHALPALAAAGGGSLVHTSSRVAASAGANGFAYSVGKLAVIRLVETAAAETKADRIRVNAILPSIIDTPANRASMPDADHARWPKPAELAAVYAFLVSDESALISGAAIPVYGQA